MIDLLQITNDPAFAQRCDVLPGMRLWVDLERMGKTERQAGMNTFISAHQLDDVQAIKAVLRHSRLMVRINPLHAGTQAEVDAVLVRGADMLMLPMFTSAQQLAGFCQIVAGRVPVVALLETAGALDSVDQWAGTPGLTEVFVGLNDLHLSLGCSFMFEPLVMGHLDTVAAVARQHGRRFGFGGIARLDEGLLPGRDVLAEHLRLRSGAVILSRTFHRSDAPLSFEAEIEALREAERTLAQRSVAQQQADQLRVGAKVRQLAQGLSTARQPAS
jgi:hypothetical protein